jgi:hypothetical protein
MVNNLITMVPQKSYPTPQGAGFSVTAPTRKHGYVFHVKLNAISHACG